jgi:hypothetical protein
MEMVAGKARGAPTPPLAARNFWKHKSENLSPGNQESDHPAGWEYDFLKVQRRYLLKG